MALLHLGHTWKKKQKNISDKKDQIEIKTEYLDTYNRQIPKEVTDDE